MGKRMDLELALKHAVRVQFAGWSGSYEPGGFGGDSGAPDLQFLIRRGIGLLPVELKVSETELVDGERHSAKGLGFRPSQIQWHRKFADADGIALGLIGVPVKIREPGFIQVLKFDLFVCYGHEIGDNLITLKRINRLALRDELIRHVAYLESDKGLRPVGGEEAGDKRVLPSGNGNARASKRPNENPKNL